MSGLHNIKIVDVTDGRQPPASFRRPLHQRVEAQGKRLFEACLQLIKRSSQSQIEFHGCGQNVFPTFVEIANWSLSSLQWMLGLSAMTANGAELPSCQVGRTSASGQHRPRAPRGLLL